ncbi:MAG: TMEM175 family protein [bacterium]|nr:TMEM175 family protein [bacterium]
MKQSRLEALVDGIFAIVMTLLVLEIAVPELVGDRSDIAIWNALKELVPNLVTYILAFSVLATYWISQHYIMSIFAVNLTRTLMYLNFPFLALVALIPFTTHLLGSYPESHLVIWVFGSHVILIGISLFVILRYVDKATEVKNPARHRRDIRLGYIRILFPVVSAIIAIAVAPQNYKAAIGIFIAIVILNFVPGAVSYISKGYAELVGHEL